GGRVVAADALEHRRAVMQRVRHDVGGRLRPGLDRAVVPDPVGVLHGRGLVRKGIFLHDPARFHGATRTPARIYRRGLYGSTRAKARGLTGSPTSSPGGAAARTRSAAAWPGWPRSGRGPGRSADPGRGLPGRAPGGAW